MDAALRRFLMNAVEMIERTGAFADGKSFFDRFGNVGLGQKHGFAQRRPQASCAAMAEANVHPEPCVFSLLRWSPPSVRFAAIEENVDGFFHVAALDDHGVRASLDDLARRRFHHRRDP